MRTEKKNQHYIPKFYLRNFSFKRNQKQIGIYHIENSFFYPRAKLKTQGSKTFYYGQDGILEDNLANAEGLISKSIKEIISKKELPQPYSKNHTYLLFFVALTHLRNPVAINQLKKTFEQMRMVLLKEDPQSDIDTLIPSVNHDQAIQISLSQIKQVIEIISDLDYKLIFNKTGVPFLTSDFPIVKYNSFLEKLNWQHGKCGYGTTGLQIFMPLNPNLMLLFFDRRIYKVGNKKDKSIHLNLKKEVNKLNELQIINCFSTLFFNENIPEKYIRHLIQKSSKYKRANIPTTEMSYFLKPGENIDAVKRKNLIVSGVTDCETMLEISGIKMHSGSKKIKKKIKKSSSVIHLRPLAERVLRRT